MFFRSECFAAAVFEEYIADSKRRRVRFEIYGYIILVLTASNPYPLMIFNDILKIKFYTIKSKQNEGNENG